MPELKSKSFSAFFLGGTRTTEYCLEKKKKLTKYGCALKKSFGKNNVKWKKKQSILMYYFGWSLYSSV
jgi:hypothetical protein